MNKKDAEQLERDATEEDGLLNWPPSRGPEPEWMKDTREFDLPDPTLIDEPERLADLGFSDPFEEPTVPWMLVWAQVTHLLAAGPRHCDCLVGAAEFVSAERLARANEERLAGKRGEGAKKLAESLGERDFHDQARYTHFLKTRSHIALLSYPLQRSVAVRIEPFTIRFPHSDARAERGLPQRKELPWMSVGWLLWSLARGYEMVYEQHDKYGVWGHGIGDLGFEMLAIDGERVYVAVGS